LAPGPASRQLTDEHCAEAEHPDRAKQRHRGYRGGPVTNGLLRKYPSGIDPVAKAKGGSETGGGGEATRITQQVPIAPQYAADHRQPRWRPLRNEGRPAREFPVMLPIGHGSVRQSGRPYVRVNSCHGSPSMTSDETG